MRYDPGTIEPKWQRRWLTERVYEPDLKRAKRPFYNLMMFPYPSAEGLHVGNMYAFVGSDIHGRFKRMQGHDVFEPIGLDGFGIHSENYALKIGRHPADQAKISEKNFYRQLGMIGNGFAWEERLETYDPAYYRWTQWIFTEMFRRGLAYRKKSPVNWCPSCKTVLADEQVITGECERCGTKVVKKDLEQWFFKITSYAERLLGNLGKINWSERIKIAQRNWVGKSEGAEIEFRIQPSSRAQAEGNLGSRIKVFTTRPDTLFGATFLAVSPELAQSWLDFGWQAGARVRAYVKKSLAARVKRGDAPAAKTGVASGVWAENPANKEKISVWVADYVLAGYGTGAIMGVPAHDQRDYEFAEKFKLPIRDVIEPVFTQSTEPGKIVDGLPFDHRNAIIAIVQHWSEEKFIGLKWKQVAWGTFITGGIEKGQTAEEAGKMEIREETGFSHPQLVRDLGMVHGKFYHVPKKVNRFAHSRVLYFKLRDGKREEVTEEELDKHDVRWLTKRELKKFLTPDTHQWALERLGGQAVYTGGGIVKNSGRFDGMDSETAKWAITKTVGGKRTARYRLRDWLISRQRYWGPPIPIIYCRRCWEIRNPKSEIRNKSKVQNSKLRYGIDYSTFDGEEFIIHAVPEEDLPVKLPYIKNFRPTGTDKSPLTTSEKFYKVRCPECRSWALRETDVSDTFLDSAWYYLRYPSVRDSKHPWDPAVTKKWLPVDMYTGGAEHAVLHLLYVRFLAMVFHDWGLLHFEEPFKKFRAHGLLIKDSAKMSKSRGNIVSPDEYIRAYGADALRMYLMFLGPFEQGGDFRDTGIRGVTRFLERVWRFVQNASIKNPKSEIRNPKQIPNPKSQIQNTDELDRIAHKTIRKVTDDIEHLQYNTAIPALMVLLNAFEAKPKAASRVHISMFLRLLAPFAPHLTEELWHAVLGEKTSIHTSRWPEADARYLNAGRATIVVQVNGRLRDRIEVDSGAAEDAVRELVLGRPKVKEWVGGKPVRRFIYVPKRIVNVVV